MRKGDMQKLVLYGNGRIVRIVYQFVKQQYDVVAFTVDGNLIEDNKIDGPPLVPLVPFEEVKRHYSPEQHAMLIAVGYVKMNSIRSQKHQEAKEKGYQFVNYIHPSVHLHDSVELGENNVILDHVSIQPYAKIGSGNFLWSNAVLAHGCMVEDYCWITSGVTIAGDSTIKSKSFFGINATIGHNITIEVENFIGANCLVSRSTNPGEVYVSRDSEKHRLDSQRFLQFTGM